MPIWRELVSDISLIGSFPSVSVVSGSKKRINLNLASKGTLNYLSRQAKANLQLARCIEVVLIFFKLTQRLTNTSETYSLMYFLATDRLHNKR